LNPALPFSVGYYAVPYLYNMVAHGDYFRVVRGEDERRSHVGTELLLGNILNTNAKYLAEKCAEITLKNGTDAITDEHKAVIDTVLIKFRENISVRRAAYVEIGSNAVAGTYVHSDNKTGAIVIVEGSSSDDVKTFAKDCCLHLAAFTPAYTTKEDVPQSYIDEQREIFAAQMAAD